MESLQRVDSMIYMSTGSFSKDDPYDVVQNFINNDITNIELSSGQHNPNLLESLRSLDHAVHFSVHNYFPPPKESFCLNLASLNSEISKKSLIHCEQAMHFSKSLGCSHYSVHAGFLFDPGVDELGQVFKEKNLYDRYEALDIFIDHISELAIKAKELKMDLLIENNVLSMKNYQVFGCNPFLMVEPFECQYVLDRTPSNVYFLLDVGHLKVSAQTLKFDPAEMFEKCDSWIKLYHLSDNNGLSDDNDLLEENSWFWSMINKKVKRYVLEINTKDMKILKEQLKLTESKINES